MKIVYSLQEFRNEVLKLAALKEETYTSVRVTFSSTGKLEFECYVHGSTWCSGDTMEASLKKLKDEIFPPSVSNTHDVEIEVEETDPEDYINKQQEEHDMYLSETLDDNGEMKVL